MSIFKNRSGGKAAKGKSPSVDEDSSDPFAAADANDTLPAEGEHYPDEIGSADDGNFDFSGNTLDGTSNEDDFDDAYGQGGDPSSGRKIKPSSGVKSGKTTRKTGTSKKARSKGKSKSNDKKSGITGRMSVDGQTLLIGRKPFAMGVFWDQVDEGTTIKERAAQVNEQTEAESENLYTLWLRHEAASQIGLSRPSVEHKAGMPALITAISTSVATKNWIGIFCLDERSDLWWLGSMHNGQVFEDQFFRGRVAAEESFMRGVGAPNLEKIYAPDSWSIDGAQDVDLRRLIDVKQSIKLKSLHPIKANLSRIIFGAILVGACVGGLSYMNAKKAEELRLLEDMRRRMTENREIKPHELPWFEVTRIKDFIAACEKNIGLNLLVVPGWSTQPISCTVERGKGTITSGWSRGEGSFAVLRSAVPLSESQPALSDNGEQASRVQTFEVAKDAESASDEPWAEGKIGKWLRERFQNNDLTAEMRPSAGNQASAQGEAVFNSTEVRVSSPIGLSIYGDLLADVPALLPDSIIYNVETGNWDLLMKAYHPVIAPIQAFQ